MSKTMAFYAEKHKKAIVSIYKTTTFAHGNTKDNNLERDRRNRKIVRETKK